VQASSAQTTPCTAAIDEERWTRHTLDRLQAWGFNTVGNWSAAMFSTYMKTPAHFALNVHFLTSEVIEVMENFGIGHWTMLQTSTFSDGRSHLNAALLNVRFEIEEYEWRISSFQTENLFSRPVKIWNSNAELPVPSE
jgi:hypothetical protein